MLRGCYKLTDFQLIKRRLQNFAKELEGLDPKQLTSREERRLRERYQEIIHVTELKKGKISPREYTKLWVKVDEFRQTFQNFAFLEMEPPTNREFDVPDNQVKENKYNLRSASAGKGGEEHTENSDLSNLSDEYIPLKTHLENLITFSRWVHFPSNFSKNNQTHHQQEAKNRNPKDSSKFSTKHTSQFGNNSTKSSENCHSCNENQSSRSNQNSADRGDNDGKQTDSKSVTKQNDLSNSDRPYPTVKTRLKNVFANLKNSIEAHSLELEHIFQDIIKEKELSFQERQELLTLWKEYKTCLESMEKKIRNKET